MKAVLRVSAWAAIAAAIIWWPTRPTGFNARWVSMPAALPGEIIDKARKAAERPSYCMWHYDVQHRLVCAWG